MEPSSQQTGFCDLPNEVTQQVFRHVGDASDINSLRAVNSLWRDNADDNAVWKPLLALELGSNIPELGLSAKETYYAAHRWTDWSEPDLRETAGAIQHLSVHDQLIHYTLRGGKTLLRQSLDGQNLDPHSPREQPVSCLRSSADGILVARHQTPIKLVNERGASEVSEALDSVKALDCSGARAASGLYDGRLHVHDLNSAKTLQSIDSPIRRLSSVALGEKLLASGSGSFDPHIALYDLRSEGRPAMNLSAEGSAIAGLRIKEHELLSVHGDASVLLWDLRKSQQVRQTRSAGSGLHCYDVFGRFLYTGHSDGVVRTWDRKSLELLSEKQLSSSPILAIQRVGKTLVIGSRGAVLSCSVSTPNSL